MQPEDFDFALPPDLIAQFPSVRRDQSRLLVLSRQAQTIEHDSFARIGDFLRRDDVLVINDSRVIRARLRATNEATGGKFEVFLLEPVTPTDWWVMMRPAKRARNGSQLRLLDLQGLPTPITLEVLEKNPEGHRLVRIAGTPDLLSELDRLGEVPLPPYIKRPTGGGPAIDQERYQTVYAREPGSVAAPTAGLHFTDEALKELKVSGVKVVSVTLHVGPGTFAPVKANRLEDHVMHEERYSISEETAAAINEAKLQGRRVIAVGTTSLRVLETAGANGTITSGSGRTRIFIYPPWKFRIVEGLITNFHLPRSTLLMLVSAFAAPEKSEGHLLVRRAYAAAIAERYRFFSYGDGMIIL